MAEFYDAMIFIVKKMGQVRHRPNGYDILTEGGGRLAEMEASVLPPFMRFLRRINLAAHYPRRIDVLGKNDRLLFLVEKPFSLGTFTATIKDAAGKTMARIRQRKRSEGRTGQRIDIHNHRKQLLGYFEGDWQAWNMEVFDERSGLLGRITKRATNVNRVIYADDEHYVVALSRPIDGDSRRKVMMTAAAALDLLMS